MEYHMNYNSFKINQHEINSNSPTYFIADIAANHDGSLEKAKELIYMASEAGANAAKFQHFKAKTIVSDYGFKNLGSQFSHQKTWKKSIFETYKDAEVPLEWTPILAATCKDAGIDFFTSPYDINDIDYINSFVPAFKVGSGDITYHDIILKMAYYHKPLILATGASCIQEVIATMAAIEPINNNIVLMQCNTNYTADQSNFKYINLNVLKSYALLFPQAILGLSDHTLGYSTVLGSIALGAKVIEKHFTNNNNLDGPDHKFSMTPKSWKEMVSCARELENALGSAIKKIEQNEEETVILQRRSLRATQNFKKGSTITSDMFIALRPAPKDTILPFDLNKLIGKKLSNDIKEGQALTRSDVSND